MPVNEQREETDEEFLARLAAMRAKRKAEAAAAAEAAKPELQVAVTPEARRGGEGQPREFAAERNGGGSDDCRSSGRGRERSSNRSRLTAKRGLRGQDTSIALPAKPRSLSTAMAIPCVAEPSATMTRWMDCGGRRMSEKSSSGRDGAWTSRAAAHALR